MPHNFHLLRATACLGATLRLAMVLSLGLAIGLTPNFSASLRATTLQQLKLEELIAGSTAIVRARVAGSNAVLRHGDVFTVYKLDVLEQWKNQLGRIQPGTTSDAKPESGNVPLEVAVPGGVAGGIRQVLGGAPTLETGKEYVLFLWRGKSGLVQLMGLSQGVFRVRPSANAYSDGDVLQAPATDRMLDAHGRAVTPDPLTLKLSLLRQQVRGAQAASNRGRP